MQQETKTIQQNDPSSSHMSARSGYNVEFGPLRDQHEESTPPKVSRDFAPWPCFGPEEIDAVNRVLKSGKVNYWTGQEGKAFEQEFADFIGTKHAISLANGTVALELALIALGIGVGDEVILPSRTFIATGSAVFKCGAIPVFADVDLESQVVTAETIEQVLTERTRAVIVVHLNGWPCDMDSVMTLAKDRNLKVVEDCAQALGAVYKGRQVGSMGHVAAFSFCQDKIMTTGGEGGMLTTNDVYLWNRAWAYKDHGKSYSAVHEEHSHSGFRWLHETLGTNWRMTEMQAAIGRVGLLKLSAWIKTRREHAAMLTECLEQLPALRVTLPPDHINHAYYKYYTFVRTKRLRQGYDRDKIMAAINASGIPCYSGSCSEIYLEKAFVNAGLCPTQRLPVARELGETSLMLLVHPTLATEHLKMTCKVISKVMLHATSEEIRNKKMTIKQQLCGE